MAKKGKSIGVVRLQRFLGFFIGIFGALAILGVFFKIMKWPNYETFMIIGFIGEASAFVIMGIFELISGFQVRDSGSESDAGASSVAEGEPRILAFRQQIDETLQSQLNDVIHGLSTQIRRFGDEMGELGGEMERARRGVQAMRSELDKVVTGNLAADAEELGRGMKRLGGEMASAGSSVERIRGDLDDMARRFESFNQPGDADWSENKIKRLS